MLHFILAGSGGGKTTELFNRIKECTDSDRERISLIVPEQYSFTIEKSLLAFLGDYSANKVDILTFTSLAENILGKTGESEKKRLSSSASAVLMSMALNDVRDELTVYSKHASRNSSVKEFLSLESEFKQNAISPDMIDETVEKMPDSLLKAKLTDISKILRAYNGRINESFFNPEDSLTELDKIADLDAYLNGRAVFIDSFRGFTAQEYLIMNHIIRQCDDVYVSLCAYDLTDCDSLSEIITESFAKTKRTAGRLISAAREYFPGSEKVYDIIKPEDFERYKAEELKHLEKVFASDSEDIYESSCDNIMLCNSPDIYSECQTAASVIKKMIREDGFRCREIAVIARKIDMYDRPLKAALRKNGIEVYEDSRKGVDVSPVINTVSAALAAASNNFSADSVLRYLKSGLSGLTDEEVSGIENYAFVWNISGNKWLGEWDSNPLGFGDKDETTEAMLAKLNSDKLRALKPVNDFKKKIKGGVSGETALGALWEMIEQIGLRDNIIKLAESLVSDGEEGAAFELERMWDILTDTLNEMHDLIGKETVTAGKLSDFFEIMLSVQTLGTLPQGLDEIIIGSADRIRITSPRAVVILGANEGIFPPEAKIISALNMKDRERMSQIGLELSDSPEWKLADERLTVYTSLCCASEKLVVSCSRTGARGDQLQPSEFYNKIKRIFINVKETGSDSVNGEFFVEGIQPAFEQYARTNDRLLSAALEKCLESDSEYAGKLPALNRALHTREFELRKNDVIQKLYGGKMRLSASQIETYQKCPFQYFCKYTLKLDTLREAKLDRMQVGNITHLILEILLNDPGIDALAELSREELIGKITEISDKYIEEKTSGALDGNRIRYQYNVLKRVAVEIIERITEEFRHCKFRPDAFELSIGGDEIPDYVPQGSDGTVSIRGKIDRVDKAESTVSGKKYVRIIDYKTGAKEFSLGDAINGINLQMLIYLFAVVRDGKGRYGDCTPAGILYYKANSSIINDEKAEEEKISKNRMEGLVLEDREAISLMEDTAEGRYIPASIKDNESFSGNTLKEEYFEVLNKIVDRIITDMASGLRSGNISAIPKTSNSSYPPCQYCDFKPVCSYEEGIGCNVYDAGKTNAMKIITEEANKVEQ